MNQPMIEGACPQCGKRVQFESEYAMMEMKCPGCEKAVKFRVVGRVKKEPEPVAGPMPDGPVGAQSRPSRYAAGRKAMAWLVMWGKIQVWASIVGAILGTTFMISFSATDLGIPAVQHMYGRAAMLGIFGFCFSGAMGVIWGFILQGLADVGHAVMDLAEQRAEPSGKRGSL